MKKINIAITGCLGRMGQQLIKSSKSVKNFKLVAVTENRTINRRVFGLKPQLNSESAFKNTNIIIDFTVPQCTLEILKIASKLRERVVIGTTGFSKRIFCSLVNEIGTSVTARIYKSPKLLFLIIGIPFPRNLNCFPF